MAQVAASPSLVAVAIDNNKNSQSAFKWAIENVVAKGQTVLLVHVNTKTSQSGYQADSVAAEQIFVAFKCFSSRREIQCKEILLEDTDIAKAIADFVSQNTIAKLVIGAVTKGGFARSFRSTDISTAISKSVPDFCTVYVINKGKQFHVKNATRLPPTRVVSSAPVQNQAIIKPQVQNQNYLQSNKAEVTYGARVLQTETNTIMSPFNRPGRTFTPRPQSEYSDISFAGTDTSDDGYPKRLSNVSDIFDHNFDSSPSPPLSSLGNSYLSMPHDNTSSSMPLDDVEAEMRRLRLELKQTMDMYSTACKEALTAKQSAMELRRWKVEEERRLEEARIAEEAALALVEMEKAKCKAALEAAEASKRIAELEAKKRINAEMKAQQDAEERKKAMSSIQQSNLKCRRYTIEEIKTATDSFSEDRKIGEGGYGPVYKCNLDHTLVAVKVLKSDASQGKSQFQQEVDILSSIRHPNMVLLLGVCPEFGCLVYEYMSNGSLEDRLFQLGNTPPIPWQHRFRIAAEIGTGLLFLHQAKPEPLVHRDLKPANILLDRNYVSKISDVGLARLVPKSVADNVTQYLLTSTAGTFCYIDPEYQQSGRLSTKSDIYSLGIILLQIVTGKPPMGLAHQVEHAIENGKFVEVLDPNVPDWPLQDALRLAELALKCVELRMKDRPDLATVILPELNRLRVLGEESLDQFALTSMHYPSPHRSQISTQEITANTSQSQSGSEIARSRFSATSVRTIRRRYVEETDV